MKHLDLFSGIGAWGLASKEVWPEREMVGFVEIDNFPQNVLRKNFPNIPIYGDIKQFDGRPFRGIDLLTGSPPCQSVSVAGKKRGTADDRWLWEEAVRVLGEVQPRFAIYENVPGLLNHEGGIPFGKLLVDMEAKGYEVCPVVLPAASVGAPHKRDRVWLVAASKDTGRWNGKGNAKPRGNEKEVGQEGSAQPEQSFTGSGAGITPDPECKGHEGNEYQEGPLARCRRGWGTDWFTIATELCRVGNGFPKGLVRLPDGGTLTEAGHRAASLKAYGNAIVPSVAVEIMRAIKRIDL